MMAATESAADPLTEHDNLISELANLEKQFADRKLSKDDFAVLSKQLKERISRAESQAYHMARRDEALAKRLRLRNYNDPEIQRVVNHFLQTGGRPLEPEFAADRVPRYPIKSENGEALSVERSLLQRMADVGIVSESLFERIPYCSRCGTPTDVFLRFKCTQCGSIDISISRMLEHVQCGTIHQETAFHVGRNLICPTCKKLLQGTSEYRLIGVVCSCNACRAHFEDPDETFFCRKCANEFNLASSLLTDVFSYSMSKASLSEARRFLGVITLGKVLRENGLEVRTPGTMAGQTREVVFSLIANKDAQVIAVDLAQDEVDVDVEPVLELYVKMLEATPNIAIFGAIPQLSKRARDVASMHRILVAEGKTAADVGRKILDIAAKT